MTQQTAAPAPAPQVPASSGTHAATVPASTDHSENVPRLLNRLQALAVVACVLFGVLAALLQVLSWQANGRAADTTEQVVRIQKIQSSLLRADALATNSFLVGGLEPADQRADYNDALDQVLSLIADAARAQPADRAALAELNTQVTTYANRITQARDNNRQGFPVGAAYLNLAGGLQETPPGQEPSGLRGLTLPIVRALVDANSDRAVDEMDGQHPVWLLGLGVVILLVLFFVNLQVARRFHRRYNVGLLVAALVVVVLSIVIASHASSENGQNAQTRDGAYQTAIDEASARTAANDAKAQESQGLINRGSGAVYEEYFDNAAGIVESTASPRTRALWESYVALHDDIRAADDGGDWDAAVALAISTEPDGATAALDEVDLNAQRVVEDNASTAVDDFNSGGFLSVLLAVLTLLGGLFAAGAASWGLNQRRREYA